MAVYSEVLRVQLVRKKHHVVFMPGESASAIVEAMRKVPDAATVDDVDTSESGVTTVVFHEEVVSQSK